MAVSRGYSSAAERIEAELRQEFHLRDLGRDDARLIIRMIEGRIPADTHEVQQRNHLLLRLRAAAQRGEGA